MRHGKPWYREPWPWLLMLGPAIVVVAGIATLWLAVKSNDGLVADDYYKQGLAINQTLARNDVSRTMALAAKARLDSGRLAVILSAREGVAVPDRLHLTFSHPTRSGLDQAVLLSGSGGHYSGAAPVLSDGRWQVRIEDAGRTWMLTGAIRIPDEREVELTVDP
jgi:hypothetical protein